MNPTALAVIPARIGSTRFPRKLLADKTGKPLIAHVIERVRLAKRVSRLIVATDSDEIVRAVVAAGAEAIMTRADHPNGTSRIAEVVQRVSAEKPGSVDLVVNVQGDEPDVDPSVIDRLIEGLANDADAPMATLASDFAADEDPSNPNIVKLATTVGPKPRAIYFSRSLIPFDRDRKGAAAPAKPLKHPGLYAYRRDFLLKYVTLAPTPLEQTEQLEQLRALEHGYAIAVVRINSRHHGIDTPEQYEAFVRRVRGG